MQRRDLLRWMALTPLSLVDGGLGRIAGALAPGDPDVELVLTARPGTVALLPGAPTRVWQFEGRVLRGPATALQPLPGSYLGPTIRVRRGQRVRIRFHNALPEPSIVHWHGLDVPEQADGHPRFAVPSGGDYAYDFTVTNRAGAYWYHPHPHMQTAVQVYQGLAGLFLVTDDEESALQLPAGSYELPIVLQDRQIDAQNQWVYGAGSLVPNVGGAATRPMAGMRGMQGGMGTMMAAMQGWVGDRVFVSGRLQPTIDVARATYRLRVLNGSNARTYQLAWSDGTPLTVIGTDGGLLEEPLTMPSLVLAPAQRADLIVDLSGRAAGSTVTLRSLPFSDADLGMDGMMAGPARQGAALTLVTLRVGQAAGPSWRVPARLTAALPPLPAPEGVRRIPLEMSMMQWTIAGRVFEMTDVSADETVRAGVTQVWEFINSPTQVGMGMGMGGMVMAHPVHLHGRQFRVLSRTGGAPTSLRAGLQDRGWLDTILVLPGETVRVQVTFSSHPGLYLYHCHILEHEDMGMMRNFRIVPASATPAAGA